MPTPRPSAEEENTLPTPEKTEETTEEVVAEEEVSKEAKEDSSDKKEESIKAVETTSTKLEPEDEERFWALHKQYETNHGDMSGEDLSDYFTLRIKSGVQLD